ASVVGRLTADEARGFIAQLPSVIQPELRALPPGPDKAITLETVQTELVRRMDVEPERASALAGAVGRSIAQLVTPGQIEHVQSQSTGPLRGLVSSAGNPLGA